MKSLEEREAQRAKQKEDSKKEREGSPDQAIGGDKFEKGEQPSNSGTEDDAKFDAAGYLGGKAADISSGFATLSDAKLGKVLAAEKAGKNRSSVLDAIATERKKREAAAASWGGNK